GGYLTVRLFRCCFSFVWAGWFSRRGWSITSSGTTKSGRQRRRDVFFSGHASWTGLFVRRLSGLACQRSAHTFPREVTQLARHTTVFYFWHCPPDLCRSCFFWGSG